MQQRPAFPNHKIIQPCNKYQVAYSSCNRVQGYRRALYGNQLFIEKGTQQAENNSVEENEEEGNQDKRFQEWLHKELYIVYILSDKQKII